MRSVAGYVVVALLLAAAGAGCWWLGDRETTLAAAGEQLATLRYAAAAEVPNEGAGFVGILGRIPVVGADIDVNGRNDRATAAYWLAKYDVLTPTAAASQRGDERDPQLLFLAANGAYRTAQTETVDRQTALSHLGEVIKDYGEVMKISPGHADAAYNFEFVVRRRDELARLRGTDIAKLSVGEGSPTIHGRPGAPPKGVSMSQFKVMVPQRSDERKNSQEAGKSDQKPRKG